MNPVTTYKTLKNPTEPVLYKDKGSKFIGYAFPIESKDNFKAHIDKLKQEHTSAGHFCFAYQLGIDTPYHRTSDDGEPSNSAGLPIYGQLQAFGVTNVLVVVVRYFGGTKLGVGGLISAYKTTAKLSLEASHIQTLDVLIPLKLTFAYKELSQVMRIIKKYQLVLKAQSLELDCEIVILAKKISLNSIMTTFEAFHKIKVETLND
ncbi:IMPACT family protein [Flavobacteriaceae bacterium]|nr:IMPACT family protein [Flavobacteriaceae bacterium]MDC1540606.1 IMPACT family protein [Flavobacteriaceae bacterium]